MSDDSAIQSRRNALKCMAYGGAGTLFVLAGGVFTPVNLALASDGKIDKMGVKKLGRPLFVQISDTHIGFNKEPNPDVNGTLTQTIALVNGMPEQPELIIHTGDITHLSKPAEFDLAQQMLGQLRITDLHTVPGEHDTADAGVSEYFSRFGKISNSKGYYSFDHAGVYFIGLINVLEFKAGGLGTLGHEQLEWVEQDLKARSSSTPIVVFAHMPLWTIYEPWGWGTEDSESTYGLYAPLWIGHRTERTYSSDPTEGRGTHYLSYRTIDRLSTTRGRCRQRTWAIDGSGRAVTEDVGYLQRLGHKTSALRGAHGYDHRLRPIRRARGRGDHAKVNHRALGGECSRRRTVHGVRGGFTGVCARRWDAVRGKALYQACQACHSVDDNDLGPRHRGVVGRHAGGIADYNYSPALKSSGLTWDPSTLDRWLTNPSALVPGTKMFFKSMTRKAVATSLRISRS